MPGQVPRAGKEADVTSAGACGPAAAAAATSPRACMTMTATGRAAKGRM